MTFSVIGVAFGYVVCATKYKKVDVDFENKSQKTSSIFRTLFGFLASLAITNGLLNYHDGYISQIERNMQSFEKMLSEGLVTGTSLYDYIIPNLHLIEFFIIAILLIHSLYVFLSSIVIYNIDRWSREP